MWVTRASSELYQLKSTGGRSESELTLPEWSILHVGRDSGGLNGTGWFVLNLAVLIWDRASEGSLTGPSFVVRDRFSGSTMAQVTSVMTDNVLQTRQPLIQDVIAPDVRDLKVRVSSLEKQMDVRFDPLEQRFDAYDEKTDARFEAVDSKFDRVDSLFNALEQKMDAHFVALMAAIGESKAQSELLPSCG